MQSFKEISSLYIQAKRAAADHHPQDHPNKDNHPPHLNSKKAPPDFRAIFISDIHLGTKDCKAEQLNDFLKNYSCEQLYLVGDVFDGWKMKTGVYWHKSFNGVIRRILKLAKQGIPIYYITGNHDEFLRRYANTQFDNIFLSNRKTHLTADKKRILVIHGDQFESVTHCTKLLKFIGDFGYNWLMAFNRLFNLLRASYGHGYWSFAAFLKTHIKSAKNYIKNFETAVAHGAKKQGFDGVICGHIHQAADKQIEGIRYLNTGDWVESCTAIVEDFNGEFRLIHWLHDTDHHAMQEQKKAKLARIKRKTKRASAPA